MENRLDGGSGRILGVDFGLRRIGLAVSDPLGIIAQGLETVNVKSEREILQSVIRVAAEYEVSEIVVGIPLKLDGTSGDAAEKVKSFVEALGNSVGVPVVTWDERFSSLEAMRVLIQAGEKTGEKKGRIDRIAATILLQSYLDRKRASRED